jgi:N-methylhydantoinase B
VSFEDYICDDGMGYGPYKIKCTMWREGDKVILDFAGTDPQSQASINFYLNENMFKMFFGIYMIMVFDPQILFNDGFYDLIDVRIPEGSLLKPKFPAALSGRTHALGRIFDILGGLLGQKTPEFLNAAGFSSSPHLFYSGTTATANGSSCSRSASAAFPAGRWAMGRRPFAVAGLHQRAQRVPRTLFPAAHRTLRNDGDSRRRRLHRGGNGIHMTYRFLAAGTIDP